MMSFIDADITAYTYRRTIKFRKEKLKDYQRMRDTLKYVCTRLAERFKNTLASETLTVQFFHDEEEYSTALIWFDLIEFVN